MIFNLLPSIFTHKQIEFENITVRIHDIRSQCWWEIREKKKKKHLYKWINQNRFWCVYENNNHVILFNFLICIFVFVSWFVLYLSIRLRFTNINEKQWKKIHIKHINIGDRCTLFWVYNIQIHTATSTINMSENKKKTKQFHENI